MIFIQMMKVKRRRWVSLRRSTRRATRTRENMTWLMSWQVTRPKYIPWLRPSKLMFRWRGWVKCVARTGSGILYLPRTRCETSELGFDNCLYPRWNSTSLTKTREIGLKEVGFGLSSSIRSSEKNYLRTRPTPPKRLCSFKTGPPKVPPCGKIILITPLNCWSFFLQT